MNQQTDFQNSQYNRRATDAAGAGGGGGGGPSNAEIMAALIALKEELREFKHSMGSLKTAFPRNDLGEPDFDGHRMDHVVRMKRDQTFEGLKLSVALKITGIVISALALIFMSGLSVHLQKLVGH